MKKTFLILTLTLCLWFFIHIVIIIYDGLSDNISKADVILVFGNKVLKNGKPSLRLKARLDKALQLLKKKYSQCVIVSGGIDKNNVNEALAMKNYLVAKGVENSNIITDEKGDNTFLSVQNFKRIMKKNNFNSVIIVSQFYHISRIKLTLNKVKVKTFYSAHAGYFELRDIYSTVREFFAFYYYLLFK